MPSRNELLSQILSKTLPGELTSGVIALSVQQFSESRAKMGAIHELSVLIEGLSGLSSNDTIFITGSFPVEIDLRLISFTGDGVSAEIYETPTYSGGATITTYCSSRIVNTTPEFQVLGGATITDDGIQAFAHEYIIGNDSNSGNGSTGEALTGLRLLTANTVYLLRVRSLDSQTQDVAVFDRFYEGELDLPL